MCAKASIHCIPKKKSIKTLHFEWAVLQGFNWFWHFGHDGRHSIEIYNLFIMSMKSNWSICKSIFVHFKNHKNHAQKSERTKKDQQQKMEVKIMSIAENVNGTNRRSDRIYRTERLQFSLFSPLFSSPTFCFVLFVFLSFCHRVQKRASIVAQWN